MQKKPNTSLVLEIFTIVSGWISAFFLVLFIGGFLVLTLRIDQNQPLPFIFMGAVMMFFAIKAIMDKKQNSYQENFLVALSVAGQALFVFGIFNLLPKDAKTYAFFIVSVLNIFLTIYVKEKSHRFFTSFFATMALFYSIVPFGNLMLLTTPLLCFFVVRIFLFAKEKYNIVGYGIVVALLLNIFSISLTFGYLISTIGLKNFYDASMDHFFIKPWMINLALGGVFLYLVFKIINFYKIKSIKTKTLIYGMAMFFIALSTAYLKSIIIPLIIITLGFFVKERALLIIGILSLITFLSRYYYQLDKTLLEKSYILFLSGIIMIAFYLAVKKLKRGAKDA